jgi:hypothetical protein
MKKVLVLLMMVSLAMGAQAQKGKDQALEALGGSCGLLLYNTYMIVGMTADAFAEGVYDVDKSTQILDEQSAGIGAVKEQYNALLSSGFLTAESDQQFIKETLDAFDLVVLEIESLEKYLSTSSPKDADEYEANRQEAWAEIARLLDIK